MEKDTKITLFLNMTQPIFQEWEGKPIRHRLDGYISATDMCKASNKSFEGWQEEYGTPEYLNVLAKHLGLDAESLIETNRNGIWVHKNVAISLAQWLSPRWAFEMYDKVFANRELKPILEEFLC